MSGFPSSARRRPSGAEPPCGPAGRGDAAVRRGGALPARDPPRRSPFTLGGRGAGSDTKRRRTLLHLSTSSCVWPRRTPRACARPGPIVSGSNPPPSPRDDPRPRRRRSVADELKRSPETNFLVWFVAPISVPVRDLATVVCAPRAHGQVRGR